MGFLFKAIWNNKEINSALKSRVTNVSRFHSSIICIYSTKLYVYIVIYSFIYVDCIYASYAILLIYVNYISKLILTKISN